ncbi:glutaredoxin family protein [Frateuria aurantia]
MPGWELYLRDHCGLCDKALATLAAARFPEFRMIWIDADPALESLYGTRIPVLRHQATGETLDWPFDTGALQALRGRASG